MKKAFPAPQAQNEKGMDLRDYFAAAALQGLLADSDNGASDEYNIARAWRIADAMMEARKL